MKRLLFVSFLLAVALCACQKAPELTLTGPASIDLSADGSSGSITFTANRDWTVSSSDSWITVSPSSGTASDGAVTVTVRCNANTTYEDRTATVTIRMEELSQTVTVRQPANLGIVLPTQSYNLESDARTIEVEVTANVQYTVSTSADWIKQAGTKGLTSTKYTFNVEENTTYDNREGTITIKPQNSSVPDQVITVKQAQKDALIIKDKKFDMPYGGGEIEFKVEANVDFDVKPSVDWIHYVETKALSNSTVRLSVDENPTYEAREGKIEIKQKNGSLSHTITVKEAGRIAVTSITLDQTSLKLKPEETVTLVATVKPDNATDKTVTWSSSDSSVASVDESGKVTAVKTGSVVITAKAGERTATCDVAVSGTVVFEDANFKTYCLENFDQDGDGEISMDEADAIDKIYCSEMGITSLKGVECFRNLTALNCSYNNLTSLNVRGCTSLQDLYCYCNHLRSLDVSDCTSLKQLDCTQNQLTSLDISGCSSLESMTCSFNSFSRLVLSSISLKKITVYHCPLEYLDVKECQSLESLNCGETQLTSLDLTGCSNLKELSVRLCKLSSLKLEGCSALTRLDCDSNQLSSLDLKDCTALKGLVCRSNLITSLDVSNNHLLEDLTCSGNSITHLDLTECPSLVMLNCDNNGLLNLNVSNCPLLALLFCPCNKLSNIDVNSCAMLLQFQCDNNPLMSLDISNCPKLSLLKCGNTQLSSLDVSNNSYLTSLSCQDNPYLKEIWLKTGQEIPYFTYDEEVAALKYKD